MLSKFFWILSRKNPFRSLVRRLFRYTSFLDHVKIFYSYKGIQLRLTKSALSMALWFNPDRADRNEDWEFINASLAPGDTFVDVGAHIGHLTVGAAKKVTETGKVFSFEAHPRTYAELLQNIQANNLNNVYTANVAISDSFSWLNFTDNKTDSDQNKVIELGELKVPSIPLDALLADEDVNLLKVDTEGFEKFVFHGGRNLLKRVEVIYFEAWKTHFDFYGYNFSEIFDLLIEEGFTLGVLVNSRIQIIHRDFVPEQCINIVAWRDGERFFKKSGFSLYNG